MKCLFLYHPCLSLLDKRCVHWPSVETTLGTITKNLTLNSALIAKTKIVTLILRSVVLSAVVISITLKQRVQSICLFWKVFAPDVARSSYIVLINDFQGGACAYRNHVTSAAASAWCLAANRMPRSH